MSDPLPLKDLCVVEIGHSLAAPYAGLIFANLGLLVAPQLTVVAAPDTGRHTFNHD